MLILLHGYTTWTLTKRIEKKAWRELHKNATSKIEQILKAISLKKTAVRAPITHLETIQIKQTGHAGHDWRDKDEVMSDLLLWTPSHGQARVWMTSKYLSTTL